MGKSQSTSQGSPVAGPSSVGAGGPVEASKALCKIIVERSGEKQPTGGFLAKFSFPNGIDVCGLFTSYHVLTSAHLSDGKQITILFDGILSGIKHKPLTLNFCTTGLFRFTCALLGVSFVQFDQSNMDKFKACHYFTVDYQRVLSTEDQLILHQSPVAKGSRTTEVNFIEYHGMDFFHSGSSVLSGSPITLSDGAIVGIHKTSGPSGNLAAPMAAAIKALLPFFASPSNMPKRLISNPVALSQPNNQMILGQGLTGFLGPRAPGLNCIYVHSNTTFESTMLGIPVTSPIWFAPTSHGWFWTPTDPSKLTEPTNWMPVSQLTIVGGFMRDWTPVNISVSLLQWLSQNNIVCGASGSPKV